MNKKEINLELGIVKEFEEFKKRMEWLQEFTKTILLRETTDVKGAQTALEYMKFYREINNELMDKKIQNVAFIKMVQENLKKLKEEGINGFTTKTNTAGLG